MVVATVAVVRRAFNRTIVELKLVTLGCPHFIIISFNRTIVELKHGHTGHQGYQHPLLIEPLWN